MKKRILSQPTPMKKHLLAAILTISLGSAYGAVITLETTFDNSWNAPAGIPVGNGFFSYTADTAFADGNYGWSSFSDASIYIAFSNGSIFTQNDLEDNPFDTGLGVQISQGQFNFTTLGLASRANGGAADFQNVNGDVLSTSPNEPNQSYGGVAAMYVMNSGVQEYGGTYGVGASSATIAPPPAIPEPSTFGLGAIGMLMVLRRKKTA
jgi:hypothetical protein